MENLKGKLSLLWSVLVGKKTYLAGAAAVIYGIIQRNEEMVIVGLGLLGLRHGITTEVNRIKE